MHGGLVLNACAACSHNRHLDFTRSAAAVGLHGCLAACSVACIGCMYCYMRSAFQHEVLSCIPVAGTQPIGMLPLALLVRYPRYPRTPLDLSRSLAASNGVQPCIEMQTGYPMGGVFISNTCPLSGSPLHV